jgi:hypothetical protein
LYYNCRFATASDQGLNLSDDQREVLLRATGNADLVSDIMPGTAS